MTFTTAMTVATTGHPDHGLHDQDGQPSWLPSLMAAMIHRCQLLPGQPLEISCQLATSGVQLPAGNQQQATSSRQLPDRRY